MSKKISADRDALPRKLRNCYEKERRAYETYWLFKNNYRLRSTWDISPKGSPEAKRVTVWHRLATLCQKKQVNPVHYIQWRLRMIDLYDLKTVQPNELLDPEQMDEFLKDWPKIVWSAQFKLSYGDKEMDREHRMLCGYGKKPDDAWAGVFLSNWHNFDPVLRYVRARQRGGERFLNIAKSYLAKALIRFQRTPEAYEKYFKDVPFIGWMRLQADAYYDQILQEEL